MRFTEVSQRFEIIDEKIERENAEANHDRPYFFYHYEKGHGVLNVNVNVNGKGKGKGKSRRRELKVEDIDVSASILSQRKDPVQYPEITYLGNEFSKIRLYREWSFGRYTPPRLPQKADMRNDYLEADCKNLGLVLNQLARDPLAKKRIINALQALYAGVDDYHIQVEGGTVQVFLHESQLSIPATRLSDGTLRYLCLLAILCHPSPPPLICIEEPELGLHPDVLPTLAELLKEAAERTQLIVTTHSDSLVDAMSDQPESVLIAEKDEAGSHLIRLNAEELAPWLEKYRLGQLWMQGEIGGTRW